MAGPVLNLTIFTKSTPHALRAISLATFPPAFLILLIVGVCTSRVNPAIGILPHFFSAAFAALLLANEKKCGCQSSGLTGTPIHLVFDLMIGIGLLVCLILGWVSMSNEDDGLGVMWGTYGTNFLIFNFLTHVYFVGRQLEEALSPSMSQPISCPQCQNSSFTVGNIKLASVAGGLKDGYAPLLDREGRPGGSVEESHSNEDGEMV